MHRQKILFLVIMTVIFRNFLVAGSISDQQPLIGLHVLIESKQAAEELEQSLPAIAQTGFNVLIYEIDYNYEFEKHPECRNDDPVSKISIKRVVKLCKELGITLIPQFQSLGHQSWAKNTWALLTNHPDFDETPGLYPNNDSIYCRSWCPLNPKVRKVVFSLYDELIDVFEAKAFHVGMDEVFLLGSQACPRCKGKDPGKLYAKAVNDIYNHLVKKRKVEMLMWGDRLLDTTYANYGVWESSANGTGKAVDLIPKDIIICDWHYEINYPRNGRKYSDFPSLPYFIGKGFRVWPTSFRDSTATGVFVDYSLQFTSGKMLGHLCTLWSQLKLNDLEKNKAVQVVMERFGKGKK